jgi:hypothetical protein
MHIYQFKTVWCMAICRRTWEAGESCPVTKAGCSQLLSHDKPLLRKFQTKFKTLFEGSYLDFSDVCRARQTAVKVLKSYRPE